MTQSISKSPKRDIRSLLASDQVKAQIALVLPKHLTADRMARIAVTAVIRTPKLQDCKPESLLSALMLCSQVGLEPDGRNAHLIPYGDVVQVIFDWKGLVALARRNGVQNIAADVVCENDDFQWFRNSEGLQFSHRVDWRKPRGEVFAAYCIWKDGEQFDGEVMTRDEIEGIRGRSRAGNNGPWKTDWREMAKKTVVRRASKKWPLDPEAATAFNADDDSILPPEPKTTKPLFDSPKTAPAIAIADDDYPPGLEPEQSAAETPPSQSAAAASDPQSRIPAQETSAAKDSAESPQPQSDEKRYLNALRMLCKSRKHSEVALMDQMRNRRMCSDSMANLEEVLMVAPAALKLAHDSWAEIDKALSAAKSK